MTATRPARLVAPLLAACTVLSIAPSTATAQAPDRVEQSIAASAEHWTDAATLPLINAGFADAERYTRLPERFLARVSPPVRVLSRRSAGLAIRFSSDATEILARWRTGSIAMPHMTDNAVRGLDLYTLTSDGARYLGTGRASNGESHASTLVAGLSPGTREFVLYLPLYESLASLELGTPEGSSIDPPGEPWFDDPPLVVYGTSIAQGACASRPGMAWPAILSRRLRREVINLGFSGNGKLEALLVLALAEIDAGAYILDCLPNLDPEGVAERTRPFVESLLAARPETPVILVENPRYPGAADRPDLARLIEAKNAALRDAFDQLRAAHPDAIIELVTTEAPAPEPDDLTADGIHPTDAGMRAHADRLEPVLRALLAPE
jgi:hypothetical protein